MNNINMALLIPFLASTSTLIGFLITYINHNNYQNIICFSLAFSSSVMIIISIFSLIPESYNYLNKSLFPSIIIILLLINIGFIISQSIETIINILIKKTLLYRLGILSSITLIIHNIPEGIITYLTTNVNLTLGITTSLAIALHNIPEGIAIAAPIYYSTLNRKITFLYLFITGFSEFLGSVLALLFIDNNINYNYLSYILGITSGIMLYLAIFNLLPNSLNINNQRIPIIGFLLGIFIITICLLLINN